MSFVFPSLHTTSIITITITITILFTILLPSLPLASYLVLGPTILIHYQSPLTSISHASPRQSPIFACGRCHPSQRFSCEERIEEGREEKLAVKDNLL